MTALPCGFQIPRKGPKMQRLRGEGGRREGGMVRLERELRKSAAEIKRQRRTDPF